MSLRARILQSRPHGALKSARCCAPPYVGQRLEGVCGSRGMASLLFVAVILPIIFVMLTITVEFAHFFGIRDELQRVLDREAHDALVRGSTEQQVVQAVTQRMQNVTGMAALTEVRHFRGAARSVVQARAEYRGAFFQFVQDYTGQDRSVLPIALQSQVRIQTAAALVVVDRAVAASADPCNEPGLQAIGAFVERLAGSWQGVADARVTVGVTPGESEVTPGVVEPVELLAGDGSDALPRCGAAGGAPFAVSLIRGSIGTPFDAFDVAYALRDIASREVAQQPREVRTVVLILRRERYDQGFAQSTFNLLREAAQGAPFPIDLYVVVLDATGGIDNRPLSAGINGGVYREVGASITELTGARLLGAMSQTITDRIVLEN